MTLHQGYHHLYLHLPDLLIQLLDRELGEGVVGDVRQVLTLAVLGHQLTHTTLVLLG